MQILQQVDEVSANIDGTGNLIIRQCHLLSDDSYITIPEVMIEAFMLGLQQVIKDGKNG